MNIEEIIVDDFGAWHDLRLDQLSSKATVFYGPNEAGKTTLLNVIRTVLYGFSEKRCRKYLPPAQGNVAGGSLVVSDVSGRFRVARTAPAHFAGGEGELSIASSDGQSRGNHLLTTLLSGVDESIFNNVFAVGLTQIQQLSSLSDTEAANQLYGLATGVDRVSLHDVTRALETQREAILPEREEAGRHGRLAMLLEQKERLQRELKALRRDEGVHAKTRAEYRELTRQIEEKSKSRKTLARKASWLESSDEILARWERCRKLNERLTRVGPLLDIPRHVAKRILESLKQVKQLRQEWEQFSAERKRIKQKAAKYRGRDTLYRHAAEIQALDRQRDRIAKLEQEVSQARSHVEELEFEVSGEMEAIGLQTNTKADRLPEISDAVIEALRAPARETKEFREAAEAARLHAQSTRAEADRVKSELESASARFGGQSIASIYRKRITFIRSLEQRLGLDDRRDELTRELQEIEEEAGYWYQRTVLPWTHIMGICGVFSFGVMLILAGVLNTWFDEIQPRNLVPLVSIGGCLSIVSLIIKQTWEGTAAERAEACRQQILAMQQDHEQTVADSRALDSRLNESSQGHLDQRLIDAREELAELEEFLPLAEKHKDLIAQANAAEHQATNAVRLLKDSRRAWKASLRTVGLPESLTPTQIGEIQGRVTEVTRLRERLVEAKRNWKEREQECESIRERIEELLMVAEIISPPDGLSARLEKLVAELEKHSRSGKERDELRKRWDHLHLKQVKLSESAQQLVRNRRQLMDAHGIPGLEDLRESMEQSTKCKKMRFQRDRLVEKIAELTNGEYTVERLQSMLDSRPTKLVDRINDFQAEQDTLSSELEKLQHRAEVVKVKLEDRLQDRRGDHKELALRCIEEKIRQEVLQWQRSALVSVVLEKVKQTYETNRQPVALAEASTHLERLTEGRYSRVWTPMGQDSLCVDDRSGQALPVEKLSRGTRELVFLALRLALVGAYARRGASMPVVLDDVFVNFDDQRAYAVASTLADIASGGQQMLIFTCHERIRSIFHELGHDVRDLPLREGIQSRTPRPLPSTPITAVTSTEVAKPVATEPSSVEIEAVPVDKPQPPIEPEEPRSEKHSDEHSDELPPEIPAEPLEKTVPLSEIEIHESAPPQPRREHFDQFTPAWRDEWLEPLPDMAPSGELDEETLSDD